MDRESAKGRDGLQRVDNIPEVLTYPDPSKSRLNFNVLRFMWLLYFKSRHQVLFLAVVVKRFDLS